MLCEESFETTGFAFGRSTIKHYFHACIGESPKKPGNPGHLSHSNMHKLQEIYVSTVRIKQMTVHDGGCITCRQVIGLLKGCFEQNRFGAHLQSSWDVMMLYMSNVLLSMVLLRRLTR